MLTRCALYPVLFNKPGGNDLYTKILLHFNGSDSSTSIIDDALGTSHTWTAGGDAQLDTGITKFGASTLLCDGTGDYVTTPDHADFTLGARDFTVDFWFNRSGGDGTTRRAFGQADSAFGAATSSVFGTLLTSNLFSCAVSVGGSFVTITGTTTFTATGWHHLALVRTGNILRLFLDGVQEGGDVAFNFTVPDVATAWSVGRRGEATASTWLGSIDEFRLSVGIARWTGNFTPPGREYA